MMTLDFNHARGFPETLNHVVDAALTADNATRPRRDYLGGSRVGHPCERALQFEFAGAPKDDGADFPGQTLRIFAIGHALEDLAIHVRQLRSQLVQGHRAILATIAAAMVTRITCEWETTAE